MQIDDVALFLFENNQPFHFFQMDIFLPPDNSIIGWYLYDHDYTHRFDVEHRRFYGEASNARGESWDSGVFIVKADIPGLWYATFDVTRWSNDYKYTALVRAWDLHNIRPLVEYHRLETDRPIRWHEPTVQTKSTRFGFGTEIDAILFSHLCHEEACHDESANV